MGDAPPTPITCRYHRWSDEDLALAFRAGDETAGETLLQRYAAFIYAIASRYGLTDDEAGDIFVEVWLKLRGQIRGYRQTAGFRPYLRAVVRSVIIDQGRRQQRHRGQLSLDATDDDGSSIGEALRGDDDLERDLLERELLALVQRAVGLLPPRFREPLVMYYRDGLSHGDIAGALGVPKNTITTRIHRGREQVRKQVTLWLESDGRE